MFNMLLSLQACTNESDALMSIYNTNGGENWVGAPTWGTDANICTWEGIICDRGVVKALDMTSFGLVGQLTP